MSSVSENFNNNDTAAAWTVLTYNSTPAFVFFGVQLGFVGGQATILGLANGYVGALHPAPAATDSSRVWIRLGAPTTQYVCAVLGDTALSNYGALAVKNGTVELRTGSAVQTTAVQATASVSTSAGDWFVLEYNASTAAWAGYKNPSFDTDEVQTVTITGSPTAGSFTLTFNGLTTAAIPFNADSTTVQTALQALSTIGGGNIAVAGGPGPATPYTVTFQGALGNTNVNQMTAAHTFTGGSSPAISVASSVTGGPSAPVLSWTDSGGATAHGPAYRFGGIRLERVNGVSGGNVDDFTFEDIPVAAGPSGRVRDLDVSTKSDTSAGTLPNWDVPFGRATSVTSVVSGAELRVASNKITFAPTSAGPAAGYLRTGDLGAKAKRIGCQFCFEVAGRTTDGMGVSLGMIFGDLPNSLSPPVPKIGVNLQVDINGYTVSAFDGAVTTTVTAGRWSAPLLTNATFYTMQAELNVNILLLTLPDGSVVTSTDYRYGLWSGRYGFFALHTSQGNTDKYPRLRRVWAEV